MPTPKWCHRVVLTTAVVLLAAACTPSPGGGSPSGSATSITELDYYTDQEGSAAWQRNLDSCAQQTGVKIDRQSVPTSQLLPKVLQGAASRTLPNLLFTDNPTVQQVAATGALTPVTDYGISTDGYYDSIVKAGTYQGKVYGLAPGVNGLALFYNKDLLAAAGVQPPSTWDELKAAAAKLTKDGKYGLAFSAIPSEEGTWQYLPFFWSNGADLSKVDSPQAVQALQFVTDLVSAGSASKSVLNWNQNDVADQFAAGNAAMMINGSWNLNKLDADTALHYGIVPIPVPQAGGKPVVALGGEIGTIPVTSGDAQAAAGKVLNCLLSEQNMLQWDKDHSLVPAKQDVAAKYVQQYPAMKSFADEVATARSRTAELGDKYQPLSTALGNAIQAALAGQKSPAQALQEAQQAAGS
ncbi:multiple sugar transport system substrate-binding protein [Amycolatopsis bartoniae]|uniref:Sugar ABC transporter substrate-binding protein n=1 Tax=Amycolatopsis bartoniae TaxID=941986 RepID=A0A8H9IUA8_9PSEU|nr:sugar ABC transporter substrate-binding protein [Amycolatopsis bartoniae]MBB2940072.1 multiple sugar transport system substrate-binding protein [Amycolatopsis bartoniae]TVT09449.1 sugar ABC transporter substrate-binding protein [Amycolatopsis bartoniae]GHF53753.1 sugar ABC transporter substrate-binding protein [Amycolatopsis bartoniae]